jgi:hypothetical protein
LLNGWPAQTQQSTSCWLFTGTLTYRGYGLIKSPARKGRMAHRVAWELASGAPIPQGMCVLHTCDNRGCVRNDDEGVYLVNDKVLRRFGHLFLGTMSDNMQDMLSKGRQWNGRGQPPAVLPTPQ